MCHKSLIQFVWSVFIVHLLGSRSISCQNTLRDDYVYMNSYMSRDHSCAVCVKVASEQDPHKDAMLARMEQLARDLSELQAKNGQIGYVLNQLEGKIHSMNTGTDH